MNGRFHLRVLDGVDRGHSHAARGVRAVVGSDPDADLVLNDRAVCRFHCEVSIKAGAALIRDLGSRNGTVVDGVRVLHAHLRGGALLELGGTQLRFQLHDEHADLPVSPRESFGLLVARSAAMRAVMYLLEQAAASDATVLIEGETGTGKELAAESIHRESARREGPFIVVDCGAVPPDLLESELFGHERGAYTGAVAARQGALRAARGGTVFLDEIGELGPDLQPKLLRALERRQVKAVGSDHYEPIDVRVIAATNRCLMTEVEARRFRSDLYYRLAVLPLRMPPLREHLSDLPLLIDRILEDLHCADRPEAAALRSRDVLARLATRAWPGNVRELRNHVERCVALHTLQPPPTSAPAADDTVDLEVPFKACRDHFERTYVGAMLGRHKGNIAAAARAAGVDRAYFYRLLWRHGLR